ncbi:hypothetical protein CB1_000054025 [Camelus ferus]|nr:hypothetical protein CB1_000054025 [Camelus ferus]
MSCPGEGQAPANTRIPRSSPDSLVDLINQSCQLVPTLSDSTVSTSPSLEPGWHQEDPVWLQDPWASAHSCGLAEDVLEGLCAFLSQLHLPPAWSCLKGQGAELTREEGTAPETTGTSKRKTLGSLDSVESLGQV